MAEQKAEKDLRCPICGEPCLQDYRPFCSKRCADVDLGRWLSGRYAIPVTEDSDEDGDDSGERALDQSTAGDRRDNSGHA